MVLQLDLSDPIQWHLGCSTSSLLGRIIYANQRHVHRSLRKSRGNEASIDVYHVVPLQHNSDLSLYLNTSGTNRNPLSILQHPSGITHLHSSFIQLDIFVRDHHDEYSGCVRIEEIVKPSETFENLHKIKDLSTFLFDHGRHSVTPNGSFEPQDIPFAE